MIQNDLKYQAFKLKGRLYTFTVMQLILLDVKVFEQQLNEMISKAPKLFEHAPLVLDCSQLTNEDATKLTPLIHLLRTQHILPIGVQHAPTGIAALAASMGLAILHASSAYDKSLEKPAEVVAAATKLHTAPVRSGQQIVAKNGDLIIMSAVSPGAEVLADGHIHIYGPLRGRALAGMSGDVNARIFCHSLDAELISIAGFYRLRDTFEPYSGSCQIYLQDEHICIEPF